MRIVCFGDSVTRGVTFAEGRMRILKDNYPALLQKELKPFDVEVTNKGVFNDNSDLLVKRLASDVLALHPDCVLIEVGGNDCNFRWDEVAKRPDEEHDPVVPLTRYLSNVTKLILGIQKAGALPILMNLLPLDPVRYYNQIANTYSHVISHWIARCGGIEHWHGMYNRSLKRIIRMTDVLTIDVRTSFKKADNLLNLLSDDGIHPSRSGYRVLGATVAEFLKDRVLCVDGAGVKRA